MVTRRPSLVDPDPPPVPFEPPLGATFKDGTWYDYAGHVLGNAHTEDAPLYPGPKWWQQDANSGAPDNYYDLQSYYSGSSGPRLIAKLLREKLLDSITARNSRDYNAGQRGMPQESIVRPRSAEAMNLTARTKYLSGAVSPNNTRIAHNIDPGGVLSSYSKPNIRKAAVTGLKRFGG